MQADIGSISFFSQCFDFLSILEVFDSRNEGLSSDISKLWKSSITFWLRPDLKQFWLKCQYFFRQWIFQFNFLLSKDWNILFIQQI